MQNFARRHLAFQGLADLLPEEIPLERSRPSCAAMVERRSSNSCRRARLRCTTSATRAAGGRGGLGGPGGLGLARASGSPCGSSECCGGGAGGGVSPAAFSCEGVGDERRRWSPQRHHGDPHCGAAVAAIARRGRTGGKGVAGGRRQREWDEATAAVRAVKGRARLPGR